MPAAFHCLCQAPVCGCCSISLESGDLSLSSTHFLFTGFCVTACCHFFFLPILWGCCSFLMEQKKGKGGRRRTKLSFGVGSFCSKFILLLIGFANWRSWIIQGIIWNWFCCRSSALCTLILFYVLLDCVTTLYKDLFDNNIFLSFLMIVLGVTNFIEIDGDRNQDGSLGCTCSKSPTYAQSAFLSKWECY